MREAVSRSISMATWGAAEAPADADVLPRLHEELRSLDLAHLGAQALDDLIGCQVALVMRFQLDEDAPGIFRRVECGSSGEIEHAGNRGILPDDLDDLVQHPGHLDVGGVLSRLRLTEYEAGILLR